MLKLLIINLILIKILLIESYEVEPLSENYKDLIVKQHNLLRNRIAGGDLDPFPSASKMEEFTWDDSLAAIDLWQAHPFGQNVGVNSTDFRTNYLFIKKTINIWFNQYRRTHISMVDKFDRRYENSSNFAVMIRESNNKVGCNFITYRENVLLSKLLYCNYAEDNMDDEMVYTKGESCSECSDIGLKCSLKYVNLCSSGAEESSELEDMEIISEEVSERAEEFHFDVLIWPVRNHVISPLVVQVEPTNISDLSVTKTKRYVLSESVVCYLSLYSVLFYSSCLILCL